MCTQTPCRLWQVEYCLHSRLFPILRFSQPNPILILVPDYSQTTPILRFFPDYSQSQMTPNLTSLPLFSNQSQTTPYAQIISRLLHMLKLLPDYTQTSLISDYSKTKRLLPFSGDSQTTPYSNYSHTTQYFKIILRLLPDYSHFQMTIRLLLDYFKTNPRLLPILRLLSDHSIF